MLLHDSVKPISYVKTHAADIIKHISASQTPLIITQNGEAKAVLQDIASYEQTQESLALLKILALSRRDVEAGQLKPVEAAFSDLRKSIKNRRQGP